ncbi:unnamed protein product [Closterium sp. Yama58-4]|nr:unnamed protein product [Closterium sp. Yama58-4]
MKANQQRKPPGSNGAALPQKRFYRARAHSNPLSDNLFPVPVCPAEVDWSAHFPAFFPPTAAAAHPPADGAAAAVSRAANGAAGGAAAGGTEEGEAPASAARDGAAQQHAMTAVPSSSTGQPMVRFADVGCGFGGLLVKLSPMFPDTLMVGFELRDKVSEYVKDRILALRQQHPSQYTNISLIRTNAMKYLPNYFNKAQLTKMFFLFPDPHFKEKNHRRRIITTALLAEYAYVLAPGGILYSITDVEELGVWMDDHLTAHPLFRKLTPAQMEADPVIPLLSTSSEEGLKVQRNGGRTFLAVYERVAAPATNKA